MTVLQKFGTGYGDFFMFCVTENRLLLIMDINKLKRDESDIYVGQRRIWQNEYMFKFRTKRGTEYEVPVTKERKIYE